jgi:PBP superfamily domain
VHSDIALVAAAAEAMSPFCDADASLAAGAPLLAVAEPALFLLAFAFQAFGRTIGNADALYALCLCGNLVLGGVECGVRRFALPDGQSQCWLGHPYPDIDQLLEGQRPQGYANQPKSHNAVAAAIAQGRADWGIAIANVAKLYGLTFLPIAPEHYDFLVLDRHRTRPAVRAFLTALAEPSVRQRITALGMKLPEDAAQ